MVSASPDSEVKYAAPTSSSDPYHRKSVRVRSRKCIHYLKAGPSSESVVSADIDALGKQAVVHQMVEHVVSKGRRCVRWDDQCDA